jgi:hypothetical protein
MKFSSVVLTVAIAASQTTAFMAPRPISRTFRPVFSSETSEETTAPAITTEDAPGTVDSIVERNFLSHVQIDHRLS